MLGSCRHDNDITFTKNAGKFLISWNTRPIKFSRWTMLNIATILIRQLTDLPP